MRIAVVGGGASGLITAHLLDKVHEVHVFEKEPILGGNVRTLNGNVRNVPLDPGIVIENGVLAFNVAGHPHVLSLLKDLDVECHSVGSGSGLFLADGRCWHIAGVHASSQSRILRLLHLCRLPAAVRVAALGFLARTGLPGKARFRDKPLSRYLTGGSGPLSAWLKSIGMEAYSAAYGRMADFPAEMGVPMLRMCLLHRQWCAVKNGTYAYMERILSLFEGMVHLRSGVTRVSRGESGVQITLQNGETRAYDKVVFATTPEQVLQVLSRPTDGERQRFGPWKVNQIKTTAHTDTTFYRKWKAEQYAECDFFEKGGPEGFGYNCCQNQYRQIPPPTYYSFAYNLDDFIRADAILDVQVHTTPGYTVEAVSRRREIIATNGENHTYHVGAYLRDGLHDGAVESALNVSRLLGGRGL